MKTKLIILSLSILLILLSSIPDILAIYNADSYGCCSDDNYCVYQSVCYSHLTAKDVDGDGFNDVCLNGKWYNCNTESMCPSSKACNAQYRCVDVPPSAACGDGEQNLDEECDGSDFGDYEGTCVDYDSNYDSGDLSCTDQCTIDTTACTIPNPQSPVIDLPTSVTRSEDFSDQFIFTQSQCSNGGNGWDMCCYVTDADSGCSQLSFNILSQSDTSIVQCEIPTELPKRLYCWSKDNACGTSNVEVSVQDQTGSSSTDTFAFIVSCVDDAPVMSLTPSKNPVNAGEEFTFNLDIKDIDSWNAEYRVNFGDYTYSPWVSISDNDLHNGITPSVAKTYSSGGAYSARIELKLYKNTDSEIIITSNSYIMQVNANPANNPPVAVMSMSQGPYCKDDSIIFRGYNSYDPDDPGYQGMSDDYFYLAFEWYLDGNPGIDCTTVQCQYTYGVGYTGLRNAVLRVKDSGGAYSPYVSESFRIGFCGDNIENCNEACDNGINNGVVCTPGYGESCNYCNNDCSALVTVNGPRCGDESVDSEYGEKCDPPASLGLCSYLPPPYYFDNGDWYCDANCHYVLDSCSASGTYCGDGNQQSPNEQEQNEECDWGNTAPGTGPSDQTNSDTVPNACRTNCLNPYCGDWVEDSGEECDWGSSNSETCTAQYGGSCEYCNNCNELGTQYGGFCGDGNPDDDYEECDLGIDNNDGTLCNSDCTLPPGDFECGNSIHEPGEECDDGNSNNNDACLDTCQLASCGDGFVHEGVEECDGVPGCDSDCTFTDLGCYLEDQPCTGSGLGDCCDGFDLSCTSGTFGDRCCKSGYNLDMTIGGFHCCRPPESACNANFDYCCGQNYECVVEPKYTEGHCCPSGFAWDDVNNECFDPNCNFEDCDNRAPNPSFELQGIFNPVLYWGNTFFGAVVSRQKTSAFDGNYVMKYTDDGNGIGFVYSDEFCVDPDVFYIFTIRSKTVSLYNAVDVQLRAQCYDSDHKSLGESISSDFTVDNSNSWSLIGVGLTTHRRAKTCRIGLGLSSSSAGESVYFDNATFYEFECLPCLLTSVHWATPNSIFNSISESDYWEDVVLVAEANSKCEGETINFQILNTEIPAGYSWIELVQDSAVIITDPRSSRTFAYVDWVFAFKNPETINQYIDAGIDQHVLFNKNCPPSFGVDCCNLNSNVCGEYCNVCSDGNTESQVFKDCEDFCRAIEQVGGSVN